MPRTWRSAFSNPGNLLRTGMWLSPVMFSIAWTAALALSLIAYRSPLKDSPPEPPAPAGEFHTRRVLIFLIDGLREDTALRAGVMPNLAQLQSRGARARMLSQPPSYSYPAYAAFVTGASPELADAPAVNLMIGPPHATTQDTIFDAVHRAGGLTAIAGSHWFQQLIPQDAVTGGFYEPDTDASADERVVAAALAWVLDPSYRLVLIHVNQVDHAGHYQGGPQDPRWEKAAFRADKFLGRIVSRIDLSRDSIIVVSDHGHLLSGGHGGWEEDVLREPFVAAGAGIRPGEYGEIRITDVAPTTAVLLGVGIPASSQGVARVEMLDLAEQEKTAVEDAIRVQKSGMLEAYSRAIGESPGALPADAGASDYQRTFESVRESRLWHDRIPRLLLGAGIILGIVIFAARSRRRETVWWLLGALLYAALFCIGFGLWERGCLSVSCIHAAEDITLRPIVTAAAGYLLVTVILYGIGCRRNPKIAGWSVFSSGQALAILVLLAAPVLLYSVWYGVWITWFLPDLQPGYITLLCLMQILGVWLGLALAAVIGKAFSFLPGFRRPPAPPVSPG